MPRSRRIVRRTLRWAGYLAGIAATAAICGCSGAREDAGAPGGAGDGTAAADAGTGAKPREFYLWVWQRSEDLSFIDPASTRLALWIATITLAERGFEVDARRNRVRYPTSTNITAVIRIEAGWGFDAASTDALAAQITSLVVPLGAGEVQIDFDATASQRDFYRRLLKELRARLPDHKLSITALASWCFGDPWIEGLPIDAAVPMYYRMGIDANPIHHYLSSQRQIPARICRDDAGYSLDEPDVPLIRAQRIFVFNADRWNEDRVDATRMAFGF